MSEPTSDEEDTNPSLRVPSVLPPLDGSDVESVVPPADTRDDARAVATPPPLPPAGSRAPLPSPPRAAPPRAAPPRPSLGLAAARPPGATPSGASAGLPPRAPLPARGLPSSPGLSSAASSSAGSSSAASSSASSSGAASAAGALRAPRREVSDSIPPSPSLPDFMVPRPSSPPGAPAKVNGGEGSVDPWREKIAQLEVQLSSARKAAREAEGARSILEERVSEAADAVSALTRQVQELLARVDAAQETAREAMTRTEAAASAAARVDENAAIATHARAATAAMRQDLDELTRRSEARASRVSSIEERVHAVERDPRITALELGGERLAARLAELTATQSAHAERLGALESQGDVRRALEVQGARMEEYDEALRELRDARGLETLLARIADVESLVVENGQRDQLLDRRVDALERGLGVSPPSGSSPPPPARRPSVIPPANPTSDLTRVKGIGPKTARALVAAGVPGVAALAALDRATSARIAEAAGVSPERLASWADAARALA